jgi:hypothetical protein
VTGIDIGMVPGACAPGLAPLLMERVSARETRVRNPVAISGLGLFRQGLVPPEKAAMIMHWW